MTVRAKHCTVLELFHNFFVGEFADHRVELAILDCGVFVMELKAGYCRFTAFDARRPSFDFV
jgi:hypothetical protein